MEYKYWLFFFDFTTVPAILIFVISDKSMEPIRSQEFAYSSKPTCGVPGNAFSDFPHATRDRSQECFHQLLQ